MRLREMLHIRRMSCILIYYKFAFMNKVQKWTLILTLWPTGCFQQQIGINKKILDFHFSMGVFYGKSVNSKIFCDTRPTRTFWPNLLRPRGKNQNSDPNILWASFSPFKIGMTQPPCVKNLGGDRFGRNPIFQGYGLTPRASGSKSPTK